VCSSDLQEINLYEDLFSNNLTGNIILLDALNLIKYLPIVGQEKLLLQYKTPGLNPIELIFDIFKITDRQLRKEEEVTYTLHFATPETRRNLQKRLSRSYDGFFHEIVEDIVENELELNPKRKLLRYIENSENLESEEGVDKTRYRQKIIIPNWHPLRAINWIAERSVAQDFYGSNFFFYETTHGYHFESIEKLVSMKSKDTFVYSPKHVDLQVKFNNNVDAYTIRSSFDTLKNTVGGLYANRLLTHDIVKKQWSIKDTDYVEEYERFVHLEKNTKDQKLTHSMIDIEQDGRVFLMHHETKWIKRAAEKIQDLVKEAKVGEIYEGKVTRIEKFGCFVELWPGTEGLVHISRLAKERVEKVESVVSLGDQILVKCIGIDEKGRIDLSRKDALVSKP